MEPSPQYERPYLDSSVFFAHIKGEPDIGYGGLPRHEITRRIFEDASQGRFTIYTSTVTLAEVRRIRTKAAQLDQYEIEQIRMFFEHEYIRLIEVNREIGEMAQEFGALYGIQPMDAIHLASAVWWKCDALLVWDKRFARNFQSGTVHGVLVTEPYYYGDMNHG